jgi:hypothetical protein
MNLDGPLLTSNGSFTQIPTARVTAAITAVSRLAEGMCSFSSGPCALFPGPEAPVQRNAALGYFACIMAMKGIVPPTHVG